MKFSLTFAVILASTLGSAMGQTLFEAVANATGNYSTLVELVNDSGAANLIGTIDVTIFGPNNAAFVAANDTLADLDTQQILPLLAAHVVNGTYTSSDVKTAGCVELETLGGGSMISVSYDNETDTYLVNNATTIVEPDITGEGGIFHGIDAVILPDSYVACPAMEGSSDAPTGAPVDSPTPAPAGPGDSSEDAASVVGTSIAMIVSVAAVAAVFAL
eukprot:scaffold24739_cov113-Cylindrotheca_fusiformis.AAC.1